MRLQTVFSTNIDKKFYLMGDSGFNCRDYCLIPFDRNLASGFEVYAQFNYKLSQMRVKVEHLFGRIKNRWRWLMTMSRLKSGVKNVDLIECCFILNNLLKEIQDNKAVSEYLESYEEIVPIDSIVPVRQNVIENDDSEDSEADTDLTELQKGVDFRLGVLASLQRRRIIS